MCVAVSASDSQPKGVLLGTMASGLATYIEPSAAVPLNNERSVVKAEMWAAEEEVLWMLTGLLADALEDVARALEVVSPPPPFPLSLSLSLSLSVSLSLSGTF